MEQTKTIEVKFAAAVKPGDACRITGRNLLIKELFTCLRDRETQASDFMSLVTENGLILDLRGIADADQLSGKFLNLARLREDTESFAFSEVSGTCAIITAAEPGPSGAAADLADTLQAVLAVIDADENSSRNLLYCLNAVNNAISIYDKDATLLFGNKAFCSDLSIADLNGAVGQTIDAIIKKSGIKIHSMEDNSSHLKMMDVLKKGEEAIDWEVRIEPIDAPDQYKLLSNDMYPVFDEGGKVRGMVELTHSRQQDIRRTRKIMGLAAEYTFDDIIGSSQILKDSIRAAKEYAASPFSFLITGESGVGKELFAQSIHNCSPRRRGPFVALNCANFSDGLIESELFGYVGGAFTGASKNGQIGKFELADGGTLFLDEIGEMPLHFQSKLLRVLETWIVTRIGSSKEIPVNVRLIAATNRNLLEMVEEGLFRRDLYYRLQVLTVEIPPLRQRGEDIPLLAEYFLSQAAAPYRDTSKILDTQAKQLLLDYDWPGNVRELRNVINRATVLSKSRMISREVLAESISSKGYLLRADSVESPENRMTRRLQEIDASYVNLLNEALSISGGNKRKAAELIGVSRQTFYRMLEKYNLMQQ